MDTETARLALRKTVDSIDALVAAAEANAKPAPRAQPSSKNDIDVSLFGKVMKSITTLSWKSTISMNEAWRGLVAARKIIVELAHATNDYDEIDRYNRILVIIRDELTKMVNDDWQSRNEAYKPYTAALVNAANSLKAARQRAVELANALNLTAEVMGAFGKLLGAL